MSVHHNPDAPDEPRILYVETVGEPERVTLNDGTDWEMRRVRYTPITITSHIYFEPDPPEET